MKKLLLLSMLLAMFAFRGVSKNVVTVTLKYGERLSKYVSKEQCYEMDSLVVNGFLDAEDFSTLRDYITNGKLRGIDLKEAENLLTIPENAFVAQKVNAPSYGGNEPPASYLTPLEYITLPKTLRWISDRAFMMTALRCINFSMRLDFIGSEAFSCCPNLKSVTFRQPAPPRIGDGHAFDNLPQDAVVNVPEGTSAAYRAQPDFSGLENLKECAGLFNVRTVTVDGDGFTLLSALGSEGMFEVDSVSVEGYITPADIKVLRMASCFGRLSGIDLSRCRIEDDKLPSGSFVSSDDYPYSPGKDYDYCLPYLLRYFRFPDGLKVIGDCSFWNVHFMDLQLPSTLQLIEGECFQHAEIGSDLRIPEGVSHLSTYAFRDALVNGDVYLPSTLNTLDECCLDLRMPNSRTPKTFYCNRMTPPAMGYVGNGNGPFGLMGRYGKNLTLYVPVGAKAAFAADEFWKKFTNIIETPYLSGTTGISDVAPGTAAAQKSSGIYTLGGQYVGTDLNALGSGVYVVNGRKVVK